MMLTVDTVYTTFDSDFNLVNLSSSVKLNVHTVCTRMHIHNFLNDLHNPCCQTKYMPIYITYQIAKLYVCQMYTYTASYVISFLVILLKCECGSKFPTQVIYYTGFCVYIDMYVN